MAETKALERENGELIDRMNRVEARLDRLNCVLPVGVLDSRSGDPDG
jgi:hypothetical protein